MTIGEVEKEIDSRYSNIKVRKDLADLDLDLANDSMFFIPSEKRSLPIPLAVEEGYFITEYEAQRYLNLLKEMW